MTNHPAKHSGTRPAGLDSPSAFETVYYILSIFSALVNRRLVSSTHAIKLKDNVR